MLEAIRFANAADHFRDVRSTLPVDDASMTALCVAIDDLDSLHYDAVNGHAFTFVSLTEDEES